MFSLSNPLEIRSQRIIAEIDLMGLKRYGSLCSLRYNLHNQIPCLRGAGEIFIIGLKLAIIALRPRYEFIGSRTYGLRLQYIRIGLYIVLRNNSCERNGEDYEGSAHKEPSSLRQPYNHLQF